MCYSKKLIKVYICKDVLLIFRERTHFTINALAL